jgi:hypothetical protein
VKILKRLSNSIGFTETEIKVILFFLALTLLGGVYKLVDMQYHVAEKFAYQRQDSLYQAIITASREKQGYRLNVPDILSSTARDSLGGEDSTSLEAAAVEKLPKGAIGIVILIERQSRNWQPCRALALKSPATLLLTGNR